MKIPNHSHIFTRDEAVDEQLSWDPEDEAKNLDLLEYDYWYSCDDVFVGFNTVEDLLEILKG